MFRSFALVLLFLPLTAWSVEFNVKYQDNSKGDFASQGWLDPESLFQRNVRAALRLWSARLQADVTFDLLVEASNSTQVLRAGGSGTYGHFLGQTADGHKLWEHGTLSRIRTGSNPGNNVSHSYDVWIGLDVDFLLNNYWIDPEPATRLSTAPTDRTDLIWILMHELGHALGMDGFRIRTANAAGYGTLTNSDKSLFDNLSRFVLPGGIADGQGNPNPLTFTGSAASALYGEHVPLMHVRKDNNAFVSSNFYHLGDCTSPDVLRTALMRGCYSPGGRAHITRMDLAVYTDLGYATIPLDANFANATGKLRLPFVVVPGMGVMEVDMMLVDPELLIFELTRADPIPMGTDTPSRFVPETGRVLIPMVNVDWGDRIEPYTVEMLLISDDGALRFQIVDAVVQP